LEERWSPSLERDEVVAAQHLDLDLDLDHREKGVWR
jgi:hypothetical protein